LAKLLANSELAKEKKQPTHYHPLLTLPQDLSTHLKKQPDATRTPALHSYHFINNLQSEYMKALSTAGSQEEIERDLKEINNKWIHGYLFPHLAKHEKE